MRTRMPMESFRSAEIVDLLGSSIKAADHVIESLRRKGWLERATWGEYLLIPAELGPEALGDSNLLALASRIADPYYIGFSTAAAHYGLTTQHRKVIFVVTPVRLREREVGESRVRIVNQADSKFFGFEPVDVLGYKVILSDREKTAIDCIDRPALAGGVGEAATILATASRRFDWNKAADYLERINSRALGRRFGWLVDHVKADIPLAARDRRLQRATRSRKAALGPDAARARSTVPSAMTRRGACSSTCRGKSCKAAPDSAGAKRSGRKANNAHPATGAALLRQVRPSRHHDRGKGSRADIPASASVRAWHS
jgi:predicted transcriptional regulator of viral defense system